MKPYAVCAFVAFLSSAVSISPERLAKWENFKATHGKQHPQQEEADRLERFLAKDYEIESHNERYDAGLENFALAHNRFSDLREDEIDEAFGVLDADDDQETAGYSEISVPEGIKIPKSFDWRSRRAVTGAKDQGRCGASYAFAALGLIEAHLRIKTNKSYDLSEQDVIDCTYKRYMQNKQTQGCHSGMIGPVFRHSNTNGVAREVRYPYESGKTRVPGECRRIPSNVPLKGKLKWGRVQNVTEDDVARLVYENGPVLVTLTFDSDTKRDFVNLGEGIFDRERKSNGKISHPVILVGYGCQNRRSFWVVKNSWGSSWGVKGFGKIRRGKNMANLLDYGVWSIKILD